MVVTSRLRSSGAFGEVIVSDWRAAGLIKPVITTVDQQLVIRSNPGTQGATRSCRVL